MGLYSSAGNAVMSWTPTYIVRVYGMSPADVGISMGLYAAVGALSGIGSAFLVHRKLNDAFGSLTPRIMFTGAMVALLVPTLMHLAASNPTTVFLLVGTQIFCASFGSAMFTTMIQDISPAKLRGQLFGISILIMTLLSSISPLAVGLISDKFPSNPNALLWAITIVVVPSILAAVASMWQSTSSFKSTVTVLSV